MTSTPTKAMLAAAAGRPYHITYGGRSGMQYTDDVARLLIRVADAPVTGAEVYNIRGSVVDMAEVVSAIEVAEPGARGSITYAPTPLPFPDGQDDSRLAALLGSLAYTPLDEGIAETIAAFKVGLADGKLATADL